MTPKGQAPVSLEETHDHCTRDANMMMSSNGNIFRVTGPLCGEFTGHRWIPHTKASDAELWYFLWTAPGIKEWVKNREAGDLRRHRAYYDVIVMKAAVLLWQVQTFVVISWPGQQQLSVIFGVFFKLRVKRCCWNGRTYVIFCVANLWVLQTAFLAYGYST